MKRKIFMQLISSEVCLLKYFIVFVISSLLLQIHKGTFQYHAEKRASVDLKKCDLEPIKI